MPYSVVAGELRTPGGCKIDNGRCFSGLEYNLKLKWFTFHFSDGSKYTMTGGGVSALVDVFTRNYNPGCVWNAVGSVGDASTFKKGLPAVRGEPRDIKLCLPDDYRPIGPE